MEVSPEFREMDGYVYVVVSGRDKCEPPSLFDGGNEP